MKRLDVSVMILINYSSVVLQKYNFIYLDKVHNYQKGKKITYRVYVIVHKHVTFIHLS